MPRPTQSGAMYYRGLLLALCLVFPFLKAAAQKQETWVVLRSPHFIVYSDGGEKAASRIGLQFEQIRDVFSKVGQNLRVDPGQPIIILAAKDEKSMASLLPEYYNDKTRVHPAGIFLARPERNYIVVRANVDSDLPFATVYHEYTHQITDLNAAFIPTWFSEGYANFFGYSRISGNQVLIGLASPGDLYFLQQNKLMPLGDLLRVDHKSSFYNEGSKANIFYAESWALVHMLMISPEFRNTEKLRTYLDGVNEGLDSVEAATRAFGDLGALQKKLEAYIRVGSYYNYRLISPIEQISKSLSSRSESEAEADAVLGTYHLAHGQNSIGQKLLETALALQPDSIAANEGLGIMHMEAHEFEAAKPFIEKAVELRSDSFLTYYFNGNLIVQSGAADNSLLRRAAESYRKCIELNSNFAPAYGELATTYMRQNDLNQAFVAAQKAAKLAPSAWGNQLNLAAILARRGQFTDARKLAEKVAANATEPDQIEASASALKFIAEAEQYDSYKRAYENARSQAPQPPGSASVELARRESPPRSNTTQAPPDSETKTSLGATAGTRVYSMLGKITEVDCSSPPQVNLTLTLGVTMKLHAFDFGKITLVSSGSSPESALTCTALRGISAKIQYSLINGQSYDGEILSITPASLTLPQ